MRNKKKATQMARYKSKSIEVEAKQWFVEDPHTAVQQSPYDNMNDGYAWNLMDDTGESQTLHWNEGWVETPDGGVVIAEGDYILRTLQGEYYVTRPYAFNYKYEKVED